MSSDDQQSHRQTGDEDEDLATRFPVLPTAPEVPEVPRLDSVTEPVKEVTMSQGHQVPEVPKLPSVARPAKPTFVKAAAPGSYQKAALASTAATAFVMPTLVLALLGYWLDQKLHHTTYYLAFGGVLLGLVVGISALLRIVNKLNE
jgi:F0F1-type ATP synthase assembly protein I